MVVKNNSHRTRYAYYRFGKVTWRKKYWCGALGVFVLSIFIVALLNTSILGGLFRVSALGQVYMVTNIGDNGGVDPAVGAGTGTLRQAIVDANANTTLLNGEPHNIQFNIAGSGVQTIALQNSLPQIMNATIIDGTTQAGATCGNLVADEPGGANTPHNLTVEIVSSDQAVSGTHDTLKINSSAPGSSIKGLVLNGIKNGGTDVTVYASGVSIVCSYLGTEPDGVTPSVATPTGFGVSAYAGATNLSIDNTLIANHAFEVDLQADTATVTNSVFGVKVTMDGIVPSVAGSAVGINIRADSVTIGGGPANANVIGGVGYYAEHLHRSAISITNGANGTAVRGNYIGITPTGVAVSNSGGINIHSSDPVQPVTGTEIGGTTASERNYIANNVRGIWFGSSVQSTHIRGNYIGSGIDGKTVAGNGTGILFLSSNDVADITIGGATAGERNIISGNNGDAIKTQSSSAPTGTNKIIGNYIGLGSDGKALANTGNAVNFTVGNWAVGGSAADEGNYFGVNGGWIIWDGNDGLPRIIHGNTFGLEADGETFAKNTTDTPIGIGGTSPLQFGGSNSGEGNTVGNTHGTALGIYGGGAIKYIQGNTFGLTKGGQPAPISWAAIGNWGDADHVVIGGDTTATGNTIANTGDYAIDFAGTVTNSTIKNNDISHNRITDPWQPGGGIYLSYSSSNNTIMNNKIHDLSGQGVVVRGVNNLIRQNAIWNNASTTNSYSNLGIDLGGNGSSVNDTLDADTGANNLQNYPVTSLSMTKCDGSVETSSGASLNSTPNTTFTIDYYTNPSWDPDGSYALQGEQWVSSEVVTTNAEGNATLAQPSGLTHPSATATDPSGNTSEFSVDSAMQFNNCQDMLQRSVGTTMGDFWLGASWTGTNIPTSVYSNEPSYDPMTDQWVDNPQKIGLTVQITVGGQPFLWQEPIPQWNSVYSLLDNNWSAMGHLATNLPEGSYDVVLTITDPTTGISMTKTYPGAVKVALPKISYTTTFTNNATPTLTGTAGDVGSIYTAYVLPKGTPLNITLNYGDPGYQKQRALTYDSLTSSFKIITNKTDYITRLTTQYNTGAVNQQISWEQSFAQWYLSDLVADTVSINSLAALKGTCSDMTIWQRINDYSIYGMWPLVTITNETECQDWFQQQYDQIKTDLDVALQGVITALDDPNSPLDFTPLTQGTYDVYFLGTDLSYNSFQKNFLGGLVVDFTTPTATLVTTSAKDTVSPELNGTVSDPTAKVEIEINGATYSAINNGDGTWTLSAGSIKPGLVLGTYDVKVTVTSLAGNVSTETKTLQITASPVASTQTSLKELVNTGVKFASGTLGCVALIAIGWAVYFRKKRRYSLMVNR